MSMRPRFLNSAFVRTLERLVLSGGGWRTIDLPVRYGLFDHPRVGRCMIDTGYTQRVVSGKRSLPLRIYASVLRPRLQSEALAHDQPIASILLTHLHADHVAALLDHPQARIYANGAGIDHFLNASALSQIRHGVFRELLPDDLAARVARFEDCPVAEAPLGLGEAHDVFGDGAVLAVPLPGHMRGHTGFVWPKLDPPLLYAADAQWLRRAVMEDRAPGPPARWIMDDRDQDLATRQRIASFARAGGEVVYCHDPELRA